MPPPMPLPSGEFAYIAWLRQQIAMDPRVLLGPGDDTAVLRPAARAQLITTDMLLEGSCFLLEGPGAATPRQVGRKAMAVNLSDIAAMAGVPTAAVVSLGLPRKRGRELGEELFLGLRELAEEFGVAVVGGDTNSWDGPLVLSVTLLGEVTARGPVTRRGAKPGDWLLVTGAFGGSILGKHHTFTPRVREALRLHELADLHAMIDVSDGLAADVHHLGEESGCGAVLRGEALPITVEAQRARDGVSALEHALGDGEDFELAFAVTPDQGRLLLATQPLPGVPLTHIGEFVDSGLWLETQGVRQPLAPRGYVHAL